MPAMIRRAQKGFTLIEVAIAAIIAGAALTIGMWYQAQEFSYSVARAQADQLKVFNNALGTYETNYFTNLVNNTPIPGVANIYAPTIPELKSVGVLDVSFNATNYYNGTYGTRLNLAPAGCTAPACDIFGLSYLTTPVMGRDAHVDNGAVGEAMMRAGGDAAYSNTLNPAVLAGPNGSWSVANPLGSVPGILAMRVGYGSQGYARFLPRDGSLPMAGNLNLGANSITNAASVTAATVSATTVSATTVNATTVSATTENVSGSLNNTGDTYLASATPGTACAQTGSVRKSSTGLGLVLCNGTWLDIGTTQPSVGVGAPCYVQGQFATDTNSIGYLCRSGHYVALNDATGRMVTLRTITNVTDQTVVAKDNCPGGTPWATFTPANFIVNVTGYVNPPIEGSYFGVIDYGWAWYAQASAISPAAWYSGNDTTDIGGQLFGTLKTGCTYM